MLQSRRPQNLGLFGLLLALSLAYVGPAAQELPVDPPLVDPPLVDPPLVDPPASPPEPPPEPSPAPPAPPPPSPPPAPPQAPPRPRSADLALTTATDTDAPGAVTTGQQLSYTLVIRNNGPGSATGVTLTDDLPAGVTPGAVTTTQGSCGGTDPVGCNLGRIASGAQVTVTVSVTPTAPGTITNQASVEANETDPNAGNNSVSTATTVVDVIRTTPLGLENPLPAGCEFVNGEIACPETASSSSISFDVDIPAGASFIEFDYAFADADEGDYGTVFLDVPAAVSE
ncbi:MAG: DUF11 domain-containing protein, partial [Pseudomonadota bacterium]|nr:DUF11 domain-containing protein [Pseudomonadota bacterium]